MFKRLCGLLTFQSFTNLKKKEMKKNDYNTLKHIEVLNDLHKRMKVVKDVLKKNTFQQEKVFTELHKFTDIKIEAMITHGLSDISDHIESYNETNEEMDSFTLQSIVHDVNSLEQLSKRQTQKKLTKKSIMDHLEDVKDFAYNLETDEEHDIVDDSVESFEKLKDDDHESFVVADHILSKLETVISDKIFDEMDTDVKFIDRLAQKSMKSKRIRIIEYDPTIHMDTLINFSNGTLKFNNDILKTAWGFLAIDQLTDKIIGIMFLSRSNDTVIIEFITALTDNTDLADDITRLLTDKVTMMEGIDSTQISLGQGSEDKFELVDTVDLYKSLGFEIEDESSDEGILMVYSEPESIGRRLNARERSRRRRSRQTKRRTRRADRIRKRRRRRTTRKKSINKGVKQLARGTRKVINRLNPFRSRRRRSDPKTTIRTRSISPRRNRIVVRPVRRTRRRSSTPRKNIPRKISTRRRRIFRRPLRRIIRPTRNQLFRRRNSRRKRALGFSKFFRRFPKRRIRRFTLFPQVNWSINTSRWLTIDMRGLLVDDRLALIESLQLSGFFIRRHSVSTGLIISRRITIPGVVDVLVNDGNRFLLYDILEQFGLGSRPLSLIGNNPYIVLRANRQSGFRANWSTNPIRRRRSRLRRLRRKYRPLFYAGFIKLGDIKGESTRSKKPKEIVVVGSKGRLNRTRRLNRRGLNPQPEPPTKSDSFFDVFFKGTERNRRTPFETEDIGLGLDKKRRIYYQNQGEFDEEEFGNEDIESELPTQEELQKEATKFKESFNIPNELLSELSDLLIDAVELGYDGKEREALVLAWFTKSQDKSLNQTQSDLLGEFEKDQFGDDDDDKDDEIDPDEQEEKDFFSLTLKNKINSIMSINGHVSNYKTYADESDKSDSCTDSSDSEGTDYSVGSDTLCSDGESSNNDHQKNIKSILLNYLNESETIGKPTQAEVDKFRKFSYFKYVTGQLIRFEQLFDDKNLSKSNAKLSLERAEFPDVLPTGISQLIALTANRKSTKEVTDGLTKLVNFKGQGQLKALSIAPFTGGAIKVIQNNLNGLGSKIVKLYKKYDLKTSNIEVKYGRWSRAVVTDTKGQNLTKNTPSLLKIAADLDNEIQQNLINKILTENNLDLTHVDTFKIKSNGDDTITSKKKVIEDNDDKKNVITRQESKKLSKQKTNYFETVTRLALGNSSADKISQDPDVIKLYTIMSSVRVKSPSGGVGGPEIRDIVKFLKSLVKLLPDYISNIGKKKGTRASVSKLLSETIFTRLIKLMNVLDANIPKLGTTSNFNKEFVFDVYNTWKKEFLDENKLKIDNRALIMAALNLDKTFNDMIIRALAKNAREEERDPIVEKSKKKSTSKQFIKTPDDKKTVQFFFEVFGSVPLSDLNNDDLVDKIEIIANKLRVSEIGSVKLIKETSLTDGDKDIIEMMFDNMDKNREVIYNFIDRTESEDLIDVKEEMGTSKTGIDFKNEIKKKINKAFTTAFIKINEGEDKETPVHELVYEIIFGLLQDSESPEFDTDFIDIDDDDEEDIELIEDIKIFARIAKGGLFFVVDGDGLITSIPRTLDSDLSEAIKKKSIILKQKFENLKKLRDDKSLTVYDYETEKGLTKFLDLYYESMSRQLMSGLNAIKSQVLSAYSRFISTLDKKEFTEDFSGTQLKIRQDFIDFPKGKTLIRKIFIYIAHGSDFSNELSLKFVNQQIIDITSKLDKDTDEELKKKGVDFRRSEMTKSEKTIEKVSLEKDYLALKEQIKKNQKNESSRFNPFGISEKKGEDSGKTNVLQGRKKKKVEEGTITIDSDDEKEFVPDDSDDSEVDEPFVPNDTRKKTEEELKKLEDEIKKISPDRAFGKLIDMVEEYADNSDITENNFNLFDSLANNLSQVPRYIIPLYRFSKSNEFESGDVFVKEFQSKFIELDTPKKKKRKIKRPTLKINETKEPVEKKKKINSLLKEIQELINCHLKDCNFMDSDEEESIDQLNEMIKQNKIGSNLLSVVSGIDNDEIKQKVKQVVIQKLKEEK